MRFKGLDLNLLVALDVLLEKQSVSRAAEQLHLSQPAVSAALSRLRSYFADPLLIAEGKRMIPTPHALRLRPMIKAVLTDVDAMVAAASAFDPGTSTRTFKVGASDYITTVIFAPLLRRIADTAPRVAIELVPPSDVIQQMLEAGELDLMIIPSGHVSLAHPAELLFAERHVVAGWRGNPIFARPLTLEDFTQAGHVVVEIGRLFRASFAELHMRMAGIKRRVEVEVSSFSVVPDLLVETNRLAVMHERLARHAARFLPIAFAPLPFELPPMEEHIQYHRARADDAGMRWLIAEIRRTVDDHQSGE